MALRTGCATNELRCFRRSRVRTKLFMTGWIGISLGDITGIGPEVTLKALVADNPQDKTRYLLIGDTDHVRALNQRLGINLELQNWSDANQPGRIFLFNPVAEPLPPELMEGSPAASRAAVASLREGPHRCLREGPY